MPSRPFVVVFTLAVAALLGACSVKNAHSINVSREGPTEIGKNDRVAVVLASYVECENSNSPACDAPKESASVESSFEGCIDTAISARIPAIGFGHPREIREKVFPGMKFTDSPRSEQDLLAALADPGTRNKMEALGLRYILVLHVETRDGDGSWAMSGSGGKDGGVIGFMKQWERRSDFRAVVVDIYEGKVAGTLDVSNAQHKAGGVGIAWIIPFPIFTISTVESQTCRELGLALGDFLNGQY
jgi:hypothetical protein